ncbi:MAG: hypothetical protein JJ926_08575 [Roseitalea sp.]|jgi:hypothetical protein|uniref:Uncharacterized protein n=1 Tax=Oceaniradius stylonematis TaxID=2184161 RepID=A0A3A8AAD5_9HYPH|nr:hypothetical protein [Oceaniradius stylonematis]MBO6551697.1 hypothetical protein [Roseitalea sp.]MBO6951923.1 hypothetical protein [Rhizobiaceae bacterium]RNC95656.1 MAG: hypothetical protein ED558_05620 [Oricola sp.]MBO6592231.1 hypothetical protein [Roseitalea sp.]MBO6598486.1 hypothetical protein [Roseitalea sp.]
MATYQAVIMHGTRGGEGRYEFSGPPDLFDRTPLDVMRALMDHVEEHAHIGHIRYEANAALKNESAEVVTVLGQLHFEKDGAQPFMCMINPKRS